MDVTAILSADPTESARSAPVQDVSPAAPKPAQVQPAPRSIPDKPTETPKIDAAGDDKPLYTSVTQTLRRNADGTVSSIYAGSKIRHLKKEDGIPLWRKDIQYDFLRTVFFDEQKVFTKYSDGTPNHTFAEIYIDAMARSSKCSKILKEKLLQDKESALCMAMVCLLVNVGRMNTTLNFFPEMRAQLRTYHSIPALQARQDPNAYKQLQDAPRLKSILKGATEDEPQPSTLEQIQAVKNSPRTNPVNLIFVLSQYAPKVTETHFPPQGDFFDLVMRHTLSSETRARAFLWLLWWYLESDFSSSDSRNNPFGPGERVEGEQGSSQVPLKVPSLESLTEEQAALENVDTEEEKLFGEVKRKERIAILASEPSPAMTALKRARKERVPGMQAEYLGTPYSDEEASEAGGPRGKSANRRMMFSHEFASDNTRSPSPSGDRRLGGLSAKPDMRINTLLNSEDAQSEASPPRAPSSAPVVKKGPGRGNWRRNKPKEDVRSAPYLSQETRPRGASGHVPLLPNTNLPLDTLAGSQLNGAASNGLRDHVPTPSYQAQKRGRGVTQHQSALISHRKQQIDYTLDRRIRRVQARSQIKREAEGSIIRAWKRLRLLRSGYDSEEESIRLRRGKDKGDKEDDVRPAHKGKENMNIDELEPWRHQVAVMAGVARVEGEPTDVGEELKSLSQLFRRVDRRFSRWAENNTPGDALIRRRELQAQGRYQVYKPKNSLPSLLDELDDEEEDGFLHIVPDVERAPVTSTRKQRSDAGRARGRKAPAAHRGREEPKLELKLELGTHDDDRARDPYKEDSDYLDEVDRSILRDADPYDSEDNFWESAHSSVSREGSPSSVY